MIEVFFFFFLKHCTNRNHHPGHIMMQWCSIIPSTSLQFSSLASCHLTRLSQFIHLGVLLLKFDMQECGIFHQTSMSPLFPGSLCACWPFSSNRPSTHQLSRPSPRGKVEKQIRLNSTSGPHKASGEGELTVAAQSHEDRINTINHVQTASHLQEGEINSKKQNQTRNLPRACLHLISLHFYSKCL